MRTISDETYLKTAHLFDWAKREHFTIWFTGDTKTVHRDIEMLPRLVSRGELVAVRFGNRLVYNTPQGVRRLDNSHPQNIFHGLGVTEGLVRFWRADMTGTIIQSSYFRGLGAVPEWAIAYSNGSLLLYEFCTYDNFYQRLRDKIERYKECLPKIEETFQKKPVVVFVSDVKAKAVKAMLKRYRFVGPFMFTDFTTFKAVPIGHQLKANIYLWGRDGEPYSLRNA